MMIRQKGMNSLLINVPPGGGAATRLLDENEARITHCGMPECTAMAVRVGVFETDKDNCAEIRGLRGSHKQMGLWSSAETAFGWA
jgi:hypothetical protein